MNVSIHAPVKARHYTETNSRTQNRTCGCLKRAVNAAKPTEQLDDEVAAFFIAQAREMTDDGVLTIKQAADYWKIADSKNLQSDCPNEPVLEFLLQYTVAGTGDRLCQRLVLQGLPSPASAISNRIHCRSGMFRKIGDYLVYLLVRVLFCVVQSLSLEAGQSFAQGLAFFFSWILPIRRRLLHENLQIAFPKLTDEQRQVLIRTMWEHLLLMGIEVAIARRKIRDYNWTDHIRLINAEPLLSLLHQDRPVILVTGHFGNFEIGGFSLGVLTYPSHAIARPLDNPYLNRFVKEFRESTGQFLIDKIGGTPEAIHVLEQNGLMAFLVDQWAGRKGCMVKFFDQPASTFKAIAVLSLQFNAPIVVCHPLRQQNGTDQFQPLHFDMHITEILDPLHLPPDIQNVKEITQWFTHVLESGIRQCPEQYWWLHRRWRF